jgi:hypothetical protein
MKKRFETFTAGLVGAAFMLALFRFAIPAEAAYTPIPTGAIMYFNAACPPGWSNFASLEGRYPVGAVTGYGFPVGTALTALESRAAGVHNHTASSSQGTHSHALAASDNILRTGVGGSDNNFNQGTSGLQVAGASVSTVSAGAITTTVDNSSGVTGTNAPYYTLNPCSKN